MPLHHSVQAKTPRVYRVGWEESCEYRYLCYSSSPEHVLTVTAAHFRGEIYRRPWLPGIYWIFYHGGRKQMENDA